MAGVAGLDEGDRGGDRVVGQDLLDAVIDPSVTTALWVADPNPRAQAFYSKNGFNADGTIKTDEYDGVREVRMVRQAGA